MLIYLMYEEALICSTLGPNVAAQNRLAELICQFKMMQLKALNNIQKILSK
jgi:hypothetical protein